MSPRAYRLGKRELAVSRTREEIVAAATRLFSRDGYHDMSLDDVAREADVARGTIYYRFGSKRRLLEAVIEDVDRRGGAERLFEAFEHPDPVVALWESLQEGMHLYAGDRELIARMFALSRLDSEVGEAMAGKESARRLAMLQLADRLAAGGHLQPGCTAADAFQVLWLITSFEAFAVMAAIGEPPDAVARRFLELASTVVAI
jgi:AcrR family transcriptional regulator